jgi:CRP-like cAMP-binding protein
VLQDFQDLRERAARLLITPSALDVLSLEDASSVVGYMQPRLIEAGTVFVREGDVVDCDHMLLILDGELSVENHQSAGSDDLVVRLMGPGSLIGEMSLLDGAPRSASCVAHTDILAAELRRDAFLRLIHEHPVVGVRLLLAIAKRLADHLRDANRKIQLFANMNRALSQQLTPDPDPDEPESSASWWPESGDSRH